LGLQFRGVTGVLSICSVVLDTKGRGVNVTGKGSWVPSLVPVFVSPFLVPAVAAAVTRCRSLLALASASVGHCRLELDRLSRDVIV
jgi:hypothetical protein